MFLLAVTAYARFAPVRTSAKHVVPDVSNDTQSEGGFTAVRKISRDTGDVLTRLTTIALGTARTVQVSGAPLQFVTRSRLMGFPDVTTAELRGDLLIIHAHLTIGRNDLGVNKARVLNWLTLLGPL